MRVLVTGATGLIGSALTSALHERGDEVVALSRSPAGLGVGIEVHAWPDPKGSPPPAQALTGADAVVNLIGEPVAQRWTERAKAEIRDSRVLGTRMLASGLAAIPAEQRPRTLVSQSATGYYGPRGEEPVDEESPAGTDFLAGVTAVWEREALAAAVPRVVVTRTGVVLAPHGGALAKMLPPFRLGVGGPVAGGRQFVPWIHLKDVVEGLIRCLDNDQLAGPVNLTAPTPVTNAELSRTLGRVLRRPAVLPVPAFAVRALYGEMAMIVVTGQRVIPARLLAAGHRFLHPELEPALADVLSRM
jgi:uncharacterized protein